MKRRAVFQVFVALLWSLSFLQCRIFQRETAKARLHTTEESHAEQQVANHQKEQEVLHFSDSSRQAFSVVLWPKGTFSYSPETGFRGEAEKIAMQGLQQQSREWLHTLRQQRDSVFSDSRQTWRQANYQQKAVQQTRGHFGIAWIGLVSVLFLSGFIYRWYRRRQRA